MSVINGVMLGAIVAGFYAPQAMAQSLGDELRDLLANHPQIRSKAQSQLAAEQGIGVARAGYLPQVRVTADGGPEYTDSVDRLNTQGKPYMRGTTGQSAMTVTQRLYDAESTDATVGTAKTTHAQAGADLRMTRQNALLEGIKAYLSVLRQRHLIALGGENVHIVQDLLNLEDERVTKGAGMSVDVLQAKQRLQLAKEAKIRFEGDMSTAKATYLQVFGHDADADSLLEPVVPKAVMELQIDRALETAQKSNPALEAAALSIDLTNDKRRTAEASYWPTVDLVGKADFQHYKVAASADRKDWSVLLTASWEIFSGWKTDSSVAQASLEHGAAMDNHLYQSRKVNEQVRIAWVKLGTARERMGLLENAANLAEELLAASQKLHAAGKETVFNVLDAENRMIQARIDYTQAYYDMASATFEILNAMGALELEGIDLGVAGSDLPPLLKPFNASNHS